MNTHWRHYQTHNPGTIEAIEESSWIYIRTNDGFLVMCGDDEEPVLWYDFPELNPLVLE